MDKDYVDNLLNMNEQNMIQHVRSRVEKIIRNNMYDIELEEMKLLIDVATDYNANHCDYCTQDNFGWCDLRDTKLTDEERHVKYCLPALLRYLSNKYPV